MLVNSLSNPLIESVYKERKSLVNVDLLPEPAWPADVVDSLAEVDGPLDIYTWFEGPAFITKKGATYLQENLFEPLYRKKNDAKLFLYALTGWNLKLKKVACSIPETTPLGIAINNVNKKALECMYATSFFKYCCRNVDDQSSLYRLLYEELPKKQWLIDLSKGKTPSGMSIDQFFGNQISYLDSVKEMDTESTYSILQYVEGYYLIKEAIIRGMEKNQSKIEIAFMLPNDEAKYYQDYPQDIEKMLKADFGTSLEDIVINIRFRFFKYDPRFVDEKDWKNIEINKRSRPDLGACTTGSSLSKKDVPKYFEYLNANRKG
jgi:hypothetical protein